MDGPSKVDGPSESGRSRVKVDGLLTESGRSFRKWTVLLQLYGPGVEWSKLWTPKGESGRSKGKKSGRFKG